MPNPPDIRIARAIAEHQHQHDRMRSAFQIVCEAAEIEVQQGRLLCRLYGITEGAIPTITYLAARLQVKPHTAVWLIGKMEEHGYVTRERDDKDGRLVLVHLTEQGTRKAEILIRAHAKIYMNLGPSNMEAFAQVIDAIHLYDVEEEPQY